MYCKHEAANVITPRLFEKRLITAVTCTANGGCRWRKDGESRPAAADGVTLRFKCQRSHVRAPHYSLSRNIPAQHADRFARFMENVNG